MPLCNPFLPATCSGVIVGGVNPGASVRDSMVNAILDGLANAVREGIEWVAGLLTSWTLIPSNNLCPTTGSDPGQWASDWMAQCNSAGGPAQQLRGFMLPLTILVLVGGLVWQGITIVVSRRGEPLLQAVRGVWNTALWGSIGVAGTHLVLKAGDSYSMWLLNEALFKESNKPPNEAMTTALGGVLLPGAAVAPFVMILVGVVVILAAVVQTILMVFREGSVVILAGLLQLAAAGSVTRGTSQWLHKTLGWSLALALYKPAAVSVYATSFVMMRGNGRDWLMGLGMLALSVIALPALMKFFTTFTGGVASAGGGLGIAGAGAAAGLHAASSVRGAVGGHNAGDHARYLDSRGPGSGGGGGPSGAVTVPSAPAPTSGSGGTSGSAPKIMTGPATSAATGPASSGTAATASGSAATGGMAGAGAAGAATGPAAPVVIGTVLAAQAGTAVAKGVANAAGSAMRDGSSPS
ncbi:hypothetical protein J3R08_002571 [Micromonospora sp. HB375]|uniref:hypothetical protein n=1 Tax=unclassified Micromonospora TaxID=2617518 RepID=UPI001AE6B7D7|nr:MULTISPECIES: hypothetical protein [unclassified Micromonospora]MBP1782721.1 hypothetical protein [Micromonospora sp. HB375]MDH6472031.1 hypothetical protein [Micromonospora sp. H404/HB375]